MSEREKRRRERKDEEGGERSKEGELAQLARASALHAEGQRFESVILHNKRPEVRNRRYKPKRLGEKERKARRKRSLTLCTYKKSNREKLIRVHGGCLGSWRRRRT